MTAPSDRPERGMLVMAMVGLLLGSVVAIGLEPSAFKRVVITSGLLAVAAYAIGVVAFMGMGLVHLVRILRLARRMGVLGVSDVFLLPLLFLVLLPFVWPVFWAQDCVGEYFSERWTQ